MTATTATKKPVFTLEVEERLNEKFESLRQYADISWEYSDYECYLNLHERDGGHETITFTGWRQAGVFADAYIMGYQNCQVSSTGR